MCWNSHPPNSCVRWERSLAFQQSCKVRCPIFSNALRYTPAGGTITVVWERAHDGAVRFSVRDTGPGIAPEHIPRLTERFYRVDRSRSRETGGTGLGLAIVKHVLQRHGASLDITSELGKGSTFSVTFPANRLR